MPALEISMSRCVSPLERRVFETISMPSFVVRSQENLYLCLEEFECWKRIFCSEAQNFKSGRGEKCEDEEREDIPNSTPTRTLPELI